jgi:hypothetical protein
MIGSVEMASVENETEQERQWGDLYDKIVETMRQFGSEDYRGRADHLIVDDNYGWRRHTIEVHKLPMLQLAVIKSLQSLLREVPDWAIVVAVDIPGTEGKWPRMGVTIRQHEIIDGLVRNYLPEPYRTMVIPGSKPGTGYD